MWVVVHVLSYSAVVHAGEKASGGYVGLMCAAVAGHNTVMGVTANVLRYRAAVSACGKGLEANELSHSAAFRACENAHQWPPSVLVTWASKWLCGLRLQQEMRSMLVAVQRRRQRLRERPAVHCGCWPKFGPWASQRTWSDMPTVLWSCVNRPSLGP